MNDKSQYKNYSSLNTECQKCLTLRESSLLSPDITSKMQPWNRTSQLNRPLCVNEHCWLNEEEYVTGTLCE